MVNQVELYSEALADAVANSYQLNPNCELCDEPAVIYHRALLECALHQLLNPCCPHDGFPLEEIGSAGIQDADGRWEVETMRYRCSGQHILFVGNARIVEEAESDAGEDVSSDLH